jgi:mono/diheme cytochrome c family protein
VVRPVLGLLIGMMLPLGANAQTGGEAAAGGKMARDVGAILADRCVSCHGPDQKKGGLDLSRRVAALKGGKTGTAIVPGSPDESLLVDKVVEGEMPPKGVLAPEQVAAVRDWVRAGAPYASEPLSPRKAGADWWSLRPIGVVTPPARRGVSTGADGVGDWVKTPIDAFILAKLHAAGLSPGPAADAATLIRRVTFDLTGLPPRPEEVEAFVAAAANDPLAYERLVDRLLASPQYGERWGRHWLDVVRFGESQGYETNLPRPGAWPYRDYVIRAFNYVIPFPQFVREQLAGDAGRSDWLAQAATGFLVGGTHDIVGNQTIEGMLQQRADDLDDMITATGTTFLGLTIQCARCHDHKFDPIAQSDYYGFQAIFAGVNHGERELTPPDQEGRQREAAAIRAELARIEQRLDLHEPLARPDRDAPVRPMVNARRNVERFSPVKARMIRLTILATSDRTEPCLDEIEVYTASGGVVGGGLELAGEGPEVVSRDLGGLMAHPPLPPLHKGGKAEHGRAPAAATEVRELPDAPVNVALTSAGGEASASSEYPNAAIHKIAHLNDGRVGNSWSWISRVPGRGSITIAWREPATIDRVVWGRDREEAYRDRLATEYYLEAALEPGRWQVVASSLDRVRFDPSASAVTPTASVAGQVSAMAQERAELTARQGKLRARLAQLAAGLKVYTGTFTEPEPTYLLVRGDPTRKGAVVTPAAVAAIHLKLKLDARLPEAQRRLALAQWIADPANPLPARVMVNRVWHYHFGRGIVSTPSDFGFNGAAPSHPELLDWLASAYVAGGWRLKPIHRLIVTSSVYRQSSRLDAQALSIDRDNRLLWRMTPRRLEAESLHDAILATSGRLDSRMGGPGYNIWEPNTNYVAIYKPRGELGPDAFRRMVYQFKPRSQPDPTFSAFDCPDAALVAPRRNVSTTALQALNLLNSRFVIQQATYLAQRLEADAGPEPARQAERGFRLAFGRAPSSSESNAAVALIGSHGCAAFCRALYNANEFVYVP